MFAVARVGAGVDLAALEQRDFEVDEARRRVKLTIPPARIQYIALDNEATQVYDRDTGLFTKATATSSRRRDRPPRRNCGRRHSRAAFSTVQMENAVRTLTAFLRGLGYDQVEVVQKARPER